MLTSANVATILMVSNTVTFVRQNQHSSISPFCTANVEFCILACRRFLHLADPHKPNQDAFSVTRDFCGQKTDALFGVYDGHGRDGDRCAQFTRDNLPTTIEKIVTRMKNKEAKLHAARSNGSSQSH